MSQHVGLILAAHGSRRAESNQEVQSFAQSLALSLVDINYVTCAFLELAEPGIDEAVTKAVEAGCGELLVVPYFLAAGRHVETDVPKIVEACQAKYPDVIIRMTPHLGASPALQEAVLSLL